MSKTAHIMKKLQFKYKNTYSLKLFLACWVAYFSTYICRFNFSIVTPELIKNDVLTEPQIATVSSAFFICYGAGQLFSGILGDKISPRLLIFTGTFISAVSNILIFFFCGSHTALTLLWGLNGIVQSLVWSPILRIAGDYFDESGREKFGTDISTTVTLGTLASYGIGLITLLFLPWNYVFLTCGACTFIASVFWITETKKLKLYDNSVFIKSDKANFVLSTQQFLKQFIISGCVILMIPIAIHGTLKDSVTQWVPTFFTEKFNLGTDISVFLAMILPVINVSGAYIARAINKKMRNVLSTALLFFTVTMFFLLLLRFLGTQSPAFALICLAVITTCMHAVNVMLITMVPLYFEKYGCVSTVGGILNSSAYIGCGILNLAAGAILNGGLSWNKLFLFWFLICAAAIVLTAVCSAVWKKFTSK